MNTKKVNFRTKTHTKSKSTSLSQQFVKIQRILTEYEKNKFHPKIQNFHYMSSQTFSKTNPKRKYLLKKGKDDLSSEKVFGPLPDIFQKTKSFIKTQKSYDITQITLASSEQKQRYVKMSKIRNPQKRRKLKGAFPIFSEKSIEGANKNIIQLFGKQLDFINLHSSRQQLSYDEKQFADFQKERNFLDTRTQTQVEPLCKKYAEIQIDEFFEDKNNLTLSQKRRITEYKKRVESPQVSQRSHLILRRKDRIQKREKTSSIVNDKEKQRKKVETYQKLYDHRSYEEEPIQFSSKGWLIVPNDSNIITI